MAVASGGGAKVTIVSYCDRILVMDGIIVVGSFVEVSIPQSCTKSQESTSRELLETVTSITMSA